MVTGSLSLLWKCHVSRDSSFRCASINKAVLQSESLPACSFEINWCVDYNIWGVINNKFTFSQLPGNNKKNVFGTERRFKTLRYFWFCVFYAIKGILKSLIWNLTLLYECKNAILECPKKAQFPIFPSSVRGFLYSLLNTHISTPAKEKYPTHSCRFLFLPSYF